MPDEISYLEDLLYCEIREGSINETTYKIRDKLLAVTSKLPKSVITNDRWVDNFFLKFK